MTISNYTELQTAVSSWSKRTVDEVVDFITLAERRINSKLNSRMAEVEATLTATIDSRYIALPTLYIHPLALWRDYPTGSKTEIIYATAEVMGSTSSSSGLPNFYTIDGANIAFEIPNLAAYDYILRYKKQYNIAASTTNDILTNYPDVYLFGSLVESAMFARDFDMMDRWDARFQEALENSIISESQNKANATLFFDGALVRDRRGNIYEGTR